MTRLWPLLTAYGISQLGNWLFRAGLAYHLYNQRQESSVILTAAVLLVYLPILVGSRVLAPIADRTDNRRMLIGLDIARSVLMAVMLLVIHLDGSTTVPAVLIVLAILGLLSPLFAASQVSYLRRTLTAERTPRGLAAVSNVEWTTFIVGTAAGPLFLQASSLTTVVLFDIATFLVSWALLSRLRSAPAVAPAPTASGPVDRPPVPWLLLVGVFALNAGAGLINVYPNVAVRDFLHAGSPELTVFFLLNGLGGLGGAVLAGRLPLRRHTWIAVVAAVAVAASLFGMHELGRYWVAVVTSSLMLLAGQVFALGMQTRLLLDQPVSRAGTVTGWFSIATFGGVTVSVVLYGLTTRWSSVQVAMPPLMLAAGTLAVVSAVLGALLPRPAPARAPELEVAA